MHNSEDFRARLDEAEPVFGAWIQSMSPRIVEALGNVGIDWIAVDMEHTPAGFETAEQLVRTADESGLATLVRLPGVEYASQRGCQQALDIGADGVIVPQIESAEEAQAVVEAASFPPRGSRGVAGSTRANRHGETFEDTVRNANESVVVTLQVETPAGIERAEEIFEVDGVDIGFVGENDLSARKGMVGEKNHPEIQTAVETVRRATRDTGVVAGIAGRTPEQINTRIEEGFVFFLLGGDLTFVRRGVEPLVPD